MKYINYNDIYFNKYTASLLDERAAGIIKTIDHSDMLSKYMISSRFDGTALDIDEVYELQSQKINDITLAKSF